MSTSLLDYSKDQMRTAKSVVACFSASATGRDIILSLDKHIGPGPRTGQIRRTTIEAEGDGGHVGALFVVLSTAVSKCPEVRWLTPATKPYRATACTQDYISLCDLLFDPSELSG